MFEVLVGAFVCGLLRGCVFVNVLWCDVCIVLIFVVVAVYGDFCDCVFDVVRDRIVEGPLFDVFVCVLLFGCGDELVVSFNIEARVRMEILIWEVGVSVVVVLEFGVWVWGSNEMFEVLVGAFVCGLLRGCVFVVCCFEVCVCGMLLMADL